MRGKTGKVDDVDWLQLLDWTLDDKWKHLSDKRKYKIKHNDNYSNHPDKKPRKI